MPLIRRILFIVILLSILVIGVIVSSRSLTPQTVLCPQCNIILISIDTLGAKHTGVYDASLNTTPFLKQISEERGVVFENAYAASSWTLPSHVSMLTGENPWDIGVWLVPDKVPKKIITFAEAFSEGGTQQTAAFSNGGFVHPEWGYDQGFDTFLGSMAERDWNDLPKTFEDGVAWVTKRDTNKPFFLFLRPFHVHDPHGPYGKPGTLGIEHIVAVNTKEGGPTPEDAALLKERYHVGIREADKALQTLFNTLETQGLLETTIIVITADHGEEFGEHGTAGFHATALYRESIHVPLIIFAPNIEARRIPASVAVGDIPKTLVELTGMTNTHIKGHSLVPMLLGKNTSDRIALSATAQERERVLATVIESYRGLESYAEKHPPQERREDFTNPYASSAIKGRWHLIQNFDGTRELYDMQNDPNEQNNLIEERSALPRAEQTLINELSVALQFVR